MSKASTQGCSSVTPHLVFRDTTKAIDFYRRAFGATEDFRLVEPAGRVGHAEITLGAARLMLCDEYPDFGALSPATVGGSPIRLHLYVDDSDAFVAKAAAEGATVLRPVADQFYGDRTGTIADPFGYTWTIATRREEVSPEEMQKRFTAVFK
jgi:PhnB protein